jgi:hypothetical protein
MSDFNVFISPFKGGSTSVAAALERVGFKRAKYDIDHEFGDAMMPKIPFSKRTLALIVEINKIAASFEKFDEIPDRIALDIRSLIDQPIKSCIEGLSVHDDYPMGHDFVHPYVKKIVFGDCKFIFVERPMDEYVKSVKNHVLNRKYKHVFGHCANFFCGSSLGDFITIENYKRWKSRYLDLKRVFPKDVLIMDLEDGWAPLASFLDFEIPKEDFPWNNKSIIHEDPCPSNKCSHELLYCERYDSDYCPICLEWREEKCSDEECKFCRYRPEKPIIEAED